MAEVPRQDLGLRPEHAQPHPAADRLLAAALGTRAEWAANHLAEVTDMQAHQLMLAPLNNAEDPGNGNVWPPHA